MMNVAYIKKTLALFKRAFAAQKWQVLGLIALSFFSGTLGGIGVSAIIPLFSFVENGHPSGTDAVSRFFEGVFSFFHLPYTLTFLIFFIIALFFIKALAAFCTNYLATHAVVEFERRMRQKLFAGTFAADFSYLSLHKLGHLDQLLTNYITRSSAPLFYFGDVVVVIANLIVYSALAFTISASATALALLLGLIAVLFFRPFFRQNQESSRELSVLSKESGHFVNESVLGMKTFKSMSLETPLLRKANRFFDRVKWLNLRLAIVAGITNVLVEPLSVIFVLGMFVYFQLMHREVTIASFAVIVYAINKVFSQSHLIQSRVHAVISSVPFLEAVLRYGEEAASRREQDTGVEAFQFKKELRFRDVRFSYRKGRVVLKGVSFRIEKGEFIGLVGPSGAGKTTVVDLLLRLYTPSSGAIFVDGMDIASVRLEGWRRRIGYVSQDVFLLNDTIENNIRFYSDTVTEKDIREAARFSHLFEFVATLPEKFAAVVGERGVALSGGQRQRIALARVLARHPDILILDEATSAVDAESELLIQQAIAALKGKVTVLAVAHRLSTVRASDRLIVLQGGEIVEEGSPEVLLKDKDSYFFKVSHLRT